MLDTVTPAPVSRARRVGSLAAVLLAVVCSLSLVFGTQPPASAFINPAPILIGGALSSAPAGGAVVGGLCATGVGCLALGLGGLAITAYATKDTWMPWLKEHFSRTNLVPSDPHAASGCPVTISNAVMSGGGSVAATAAIGASCPGSGKLVATEVKCVANVAFGSFVKGQIYSGGQNIASATVISKNFSTSIPATNICDGSGRSVPIFAHLFIETAGADGRSVHVEVQNPIPEDLFTQTTTINCLRPDGSTFTLTDKEMGHPERMTVPSCRASDPAAIPLDFDVKDPFGQSMIDVTFPDWMTDYPNCFGPSGLLCEIAVYIDGQPCVPGMDGCEYWWSRKDSQTRDYDCRFGSYVVPFVECEALKRSYRTGATPDTITEPVPWPDPGPDPNPEPPPEPEPSPSPSPSPTASPSAPPTSGPNPNPPPVDPEVTNPDSQSCLGASWSWNPVSWVYAPVKCALIWAFVPKTALSIRIDRIKVALGNKAPFSWFGGFGSIPVAIPSGDCPNWVVKVDGKSENVVCGRPYTEAIRAMRPVLLVFMGALALWPLIRSTAYAAFPIIKPQPGMLR